MTNDEKVVVLGATGQQGGAVIRHLLKNGYTNVHAVVRSAQEEKAKALEQQGVTLVVADLDDQASLDAAIDGALGVFSVIPIDPKDMKIEVPRGKAVANAAKNAGVKHFVYSSVNRADRGTEVPHFQTKRTIEQYITQLGLPATIVRPSAFMDNFLNFMHPQIHEGVVVFRQPFHPTTTLQMIAVDDIGRIVADIFSKPDKFIGKTLEIAGEELTFPEIAKTFERVVGQPARFEEQPIEEVRGFNKDLAAMFSWLNKEGYNADIAKLRENYPGLITFAAWFDQHRNAFKSM